jgi:hypothetical protein
MDMDTAVQAKFDAFEFPGYAESKLLGAAAGSQKHGVKPVKVGPVAVSISYVGAAISVDIHVDAVGGFSARSFPTIKLSPSHRKDTASLSWGSVVELAKATVTLTLDLDKRAVHVAVRSGGALSKAIGAHDFTIPYVDPASNLPDLSRLTGMKLLGHDELQAWLDGGKWVDMPGPSAAGPTSSSSLVSEILTMLGASNLISDAREYIHKVESQVRRSDDDSSEAPIAFGAPFVVGGREILIALGVEGDGNLGFASGQAGAGIYITRDDVGLYNTTTAGLGFGLEFAVQGKLALYLGLSDRKGAALEVFKGAAMYAQVSAAHVVEVENRVVFVLNDEMEPVFAGASIGLGVGEGVSGSAGILYNGAHSFKRSG